MGCGLPVLPFYVGSERLDKRMVSPLLATMLVPGSEAERDLLWLSCNAAFLSNWRAENPGRPVPDDFDAAGTIETLHLAYEIQRPLAQVLEGARRHYVRGVRAAMVLVTRLKLSMHHPERLHTKEAAVGWLSDWFGEDYAATDSEGNDEEKRRGKYWTHQHERFAASEGTFSSDWIDYQSVSHLWAAYYLDSETAWEDWDDPELWLEHDLEDKLAVAEFLRVEGERHGVLRPGEAWFVPSEIQLPRVSIDLKPMSDDQLEQIEKASS